MDLYRVTRRETQSLQPTSSTFWSITVLYCGYDRDDARAAYHASTPSDVCGSYGNSARETCCEVISDARTSDFSEDEAGAVSEASEK